MTLVKICGVTRPADARLAERAGAYAIGLNFYEKSPRAIAPSDAWEIRRHLDPGTEAVGVFVNWRARLVVVLARALDLSAIQLHGDEPPADVVYCAKHLPVIRALRVGSGFPLARLRQFRQASALLLDAAQKGQYGGSGKTADWAVAREFVERATKFRRPLFLAGGLTPENVYEAILRVRPYAVDVASGVESRPGIKDAGKVRAFFSEVLRADKSLST